MSGGQGITFSSAQTAPGSSQWAELVIPLAEFTRVGNDQSRSLQNAGKWQVLVNASATVNVAVNSLYTFGGYDTDVGDAGADYQYRVRPRSSSTGVVGNPSPATRYGVNPRREQVLVDVPSTTYDPQIDTWDVFRYGGTVTSWRYIGSIKVGSTAPFYDTYGDDAASAGDALDFDNFEPWPTVGLPITGNVTQLAGTVAVVESTDQTILRLLPGTLVEIGAQNVYTLRVRPTLVSAGPPATYLLQFEENAGAAGAGVTLPYTIQEPIVARQFLPYSWGPDASGVVFAVGDPLRPGTLYFAKPYAPDSAPDANNIEVVQPSEPLLGGIVVDGLGFVGSTERWWALYPQPTNPAQLYNAVQTPDTRGPIAPYGICTDGRKRYWWAKDGIYSDDGSLTDEDLYPIFPHEDVSGRDYQYHGVTVFAPDYNLAPKFRLVYSNSYLYAIYPVASGAYKMLVCDLRRKAWMTDQYHVEITAAYHVEQQPESSGALNPIMLMAGESAPGSGVGALYNPLAGQNDDTTSITAQLATFEFDGGDLRAPKQWGDLFLDIDTEAGGAGGTSVALLDQGSIIAGPLPVATGGGGTRLRIPVDLGGVVISDFAGLYITWNDDFSVQALPTKLYAWQPSFVIQPAKGLGWYTFGTTFALDGYMHIRELMLAWVSTAPVTLAITSYDGQSPAQITIPSSGGALQKAYFPLTANKGLLYKFVAQSAQPFQLWLDQSEVHVGEWARQGPYATSRSFGPPQVSSGVV